MDIPFDKNMVLTDVRSHTEYANGHVKQSIHFPPEEQADLAYIARFEESDNVYLYDNGNNHAFTVASLFKRQGFHNLRVVLGGYETIASTAGIETEKDAAALN